MFESYSSQNVGNLIEEIVQFAEGHLSIFKHDGHFVGVFLSCESKVIINVEPLFLVGYHFSKNFCNSIHQPI